MSTLRIANESPLKQIMGHVDKSEIEFSKSLPARLFRAVKKRADRGSITKLENNARFMAL